MDSLSDITSIGWCISKPFATSNNCIAREKQIKSWSRAKKVSLIGSLNPTWDDLAADWGTKVEPLLSKADSSLRSE
jgi:hypothetical protein